MSMKTVLKKLTSMVLVICMFVSLAAPAVGDAPLPQPTEEAVLPDGTTVYADGSLVYADGTIVYADGTTVRADGTTVDANGTVVYPDGTMVYADGKMVYANGTVVYPDGTTVYADGSVLYSDGTIVFADGTTVHPDGVTVNADGTTVYPDGTTIYTDGTIVYVDGTRAYPDGTVVCADGTTLKPDGTTVYPDGTTVYADGMTVYPDGTTVYADGTTLNPDGTTVYPDGTTVYADGTTLNPDGTTVYPDGTTVYADGTTLNPDGTTVYPDGTKVYADGTTVTPDGITVYPDGTKVYADGTTVTPDGITVYPDGTTVYADGTTVYPDGTTVYPDGSTDPLPEEEPVVLEEPEPVVPANVTETPEETPADPVIPTDPTTAEETQPATDPATDGETEEITEPVTETEEANTETEEAGAPEEDEENKTEETSEESAEKTTEETAEGTTEKTTEETTEETAEQTTEKTAEETADAAPAEELPLRTLTVSADQMAFRDQFLNPKEPVLWSGSVWSALYGTAIEPVYADGHVTVEISGHLPETVTARAMFVEFADPGAAQNDERALMLLDVALLDETGAFYVPAEALHVSVSDASVYGAVANGEPFAAYFDDAYDGVGDTGDVRVGLDDNIDGDRLAYIPGLRDTLLFWEAGDRLVSTENGTVDFDTNRFPFRFVLSAQQEPRPEEQPEEQNQDEQPEEQQNAVKDVTLSGTLVASDGYTYEIGVNYPADCGLPVGAELSVEELIVGTDAYWDYINQSAAELGVSPADLSLARAFDISLVDPATGVHYQPTKDVQVSILLISTPVNTEEEIAVLHFDDEAGAVQPMDVALNGEAIEFKTGGFSVYTVLQKSKNNNLLAADGTENKNGDGTGEETTDGTEVVAASENTSVPDNVLTREYVTQDGSWAYWRVTVNPEAQTLNGDNYLTLIDTFDDGIDGDAHQAIDYSSVTVTSDAGITYDYSNITGTFVIPDATSVTITYRTHITAQPGEEVLFRGTARLQDGAGNTLASATAGATEEKVAIYPSPSEASGSGNNYMLKLYVYAENAMQQGIEGAQFILLDANQRTLTYKQGDNKGQPVVFTSGSDGYVNIELNEEPGDISIEKNTGYYLEMIQAVDGYQKDNTLYSFMITDNPAYSSGGFYKYYNGDTMKVRLYPANAGLSVSIRFSGSYTMREDQQNSVTAVLQKLDDEDNWIEVERHPYTDAQYGAIKFTEVLYSGELQYQNIYRVIEENQSPWDLPEDINLETTYYCMINSAGSEPYAEPREFSVTGADDSVSVVIDNRYEESQLTIVKMDKSTGEVLPGAEFSVYRIVSGAESGDAVKTYTTDSDGELVIRGGSPFEAEILYGIRETKAPTGYLLPIQPEWHYFYFCNDEYLEPSILANLPEDATAVNLTNSGDRITIDNQKETITIPVMKIWQSNNWPAGAEVVVGLYQPDDAGSVKPVLDPYNNPLTVTLTAAMPYNNTAFANLPSRDEQGNIAYSIKEENINNQKPLEAGYVQEYGVSSSGVYIVRNKPAATLTVSKEWLDPISGEKVTDETVLAAQSSVTFDVYRSTTAFVDPTPEDGITNAEMTSFVNGCVKVREGLRFGAGESWSISINDLDKQDDLGKPYYYYVLETVPSFGNELYEVDEAAGTVKILNKIAPQTVTLTVTKAALEKDPRPESLNKDFEFTLKLQADATHPVRNWQVYTDTENPDNNLITDWNGEVTFTLKPTNPDSQPTPGASITLTLPTGVTVSVTEAYDHEFTVDTAATVTGEKADNGRTYSYSTGSVAGSENTLTYTNTLRVICKVVDNNGEQTPFETLSRALQYIRENSTSFTSPWTIYLLEDYTIPATDVVEVVEGESLTITTASTTDQLFPFKGGEETDRAVITRGGAGGSILKNAGTLTLEKICLDGNGTNLTASGDGGLVYSTGTLNLNAETTLRNSAAAGTGGAVYAAGTVNMVDGVAITGNSASSASALYLRGTLNMTGGSITGNSGAADGAVVVGDAGDVINLSGSPKITNNTNSQGKAANLYVGVDSDNIVNVVDPGLGENAQIGITAMEGHMLIGEQFATAEYGQTDNLARFINDSYGYHGKLKDGTSTNIVWDGLTVTIQKHVDQDGANPNDRFTITLSSPSITMSSYIIDGTLDYTITPARPNRPGRIIFRDVKAGDVYTISPLPVGSYTITEADSNYRPVYTQSAAGGEGQTIETGAFEASEDCTVTVTNTRRQADVKLTKTLYDSLKSAEETQAFAFTVKLTEADGTAVSGFTLAEGLTTDSSGEADFTLAPSNTTDAICDLRAPVGATMTITETVDSNYRITASAKTMPAEGEGEAITDADTDSGNVFTFLVTDDGADVTFANVRKLAEIELSKVLVNKVSETESFSFTLTLTRADGTPAAGYMVYEDADLEKSIVTDENGQAKITFDFLRVENPSEENPSKSVTLTIPEGTKLEVEETEVKKTVGSTERAIYDTSYSVNGNAAVTGLKATIASVSDNDHKIAFTNTRKTRTITVTNTVSGYSGNVVPFTYTATVTDGGEGQDDYDANGFTDGVMTFELTTGQSQSLIVPYGAKLTVTEEFIVGYKTTIKHESTNLGTTLFDEFDVLNDVTVAFTNAQLIGLRLVNETSSTLNDVKVTVGTGTEIYRVNDDQTGQEKINQGSNKYATLSIEAGKTAILEITHQTSVTAEQTYTVNGAMPAIGYYYTINNEPSFHETADPAVLRVYDTKNYEVKGKLRYSVSDSTVTFTEQPLVSFDVNGGRWTTEMDGYHDRDGDRKVYQKAVDSGKTVERPNPDPVYPTAENIPFLGWTENKDFATKQDHTPGEDISNEAYNFDTKVTAPVTLYAVWAKPARNERVVTVKNELTSSLDVTVTLTNDDPAGANYTLYEDTDEPDNSIITGTDGKAAFTLEAGKAKNLHVPNGAKLVISGSDGMAYSTDYTHADSDTGSFTIDSVDNDGTVSFIGGIFKITDENGNLLYDANGRPAVYWNLRKISNTDPDEAFDAYEKTLYTNVSHTTPATPAAVKQLVDEYWIPNTAAIAFPNATMTLTTAGNSDTDFPYTGVRDRVTIYRTTAGANANCFTLANGNITLTEIILDGGSEQGVKIAAGKNGGLISMTNGTLNVSTGTTLRNVVYASYNSTSCGGAIYMTNGSLNVSAGLFSNLHAYQGGAICVTGGTLNVIGTAGSTRFENCISENGNECDGGAIYYKVSSPLAINGGSDKNNPGIVFQSCVALGNKATGDDANKSSGGAIYADTSSNHPVTVSGCSFIECSARTTEKSNAGNGGGAICANNVSALNVSGCLFTACDTLSRGGAIVTYIKNGGTVSIADSSFDNCNCKGQGGALAVYQPNQESGSAPTAAKTSKLIVDHSSFNNCSSGTNNGSGGAIQCYVPCMEFYYTDFTDCWAGKEGGAVNNYFANGYTAVWNSSYLILDNCKFIRCRAEDRYDPTALQHYGGGINTKVTTVTVTDSYFEDCVSTLKEGGALHLGGQGGGSTATITGSTFKNCMAKNGGGALLSSHETLTIENSYFYGCSSSASNGGAVYHTRNSRGDSTQKTTTITDCTFSADPGNAGSAGCIAANNGGAIWTRASTASITGCTISNCVANNGGAVYLSKEKTASQSGTVANGSITECAAVKGSAVYVENKATFSGGLEVSGNTVSDVNSGAIQTVNTGKLYFEGNVLVKQNTCSADSTYNHDVLMQINGNTIINTSSVGLDSGASIGVYVSDPNSAYANRGLEGQAFGTYGSSNYLDAFFNNRNGELYGCQMSADDTKIYWGNYVCKITDADGNTLTRPNGRDAVYQRLSQALDEFTLVTGGSAVYIKMLIEDYTIRQTAAISNFPNAKITLTTAATSDAEHPYRGTEGTVCTISRTSGTEQLFKLNNADAVFQLEGITLDGRNDKSTETGNRRLIEAAQGALVINGGTTLQYGAASNGGAIDAAAAAQVTVNGVYDSASKEPTVRFRQQGADGQVY